MEGFSRDRFLANVPEDGWAEEEGQTTTPTPIRETSYQAMLRDRLSIPSPFNSPPPLRSSAAPSHDGSGTSEPFNSNNVITPPSTPRPQISRGPTGKAFSPPPSSRSPQPSPVSSQCMRTPLTGNSPVSLSRMHTNQRSPFTTPHHPTRSMCTHVSHSRILESFGICPTHQSIAWGHSGSLLVIIDGCVYMYTSEQECEMLLDGTADPLSVVSSSDQQYAAIGLKDGLIYPYQFNAVDGIVALPQLQDLTEAISSMYLCGSVLFVGTVGGVVAIFDLDMQSTNDSCLGRHSMGNSPIRAVASTQDGDHYAVSTQFECRIYNRSKGSSSWHMARDDQTTEYAATCACWFEGGSLGVAVAIGGGNGGTSVLLRSVGGSVFLSEDTGCEVLAMSSLNHRDMLVVSHGDCPRSYCSWDAGSEMKRSIVAYTIHIGDGCLTPTYKMRGHSSCPINLTTKRDEIVTAASGDDDTIRFWTLPSPHTTVFASLQFDELR